MPMQFEEDADIVQSASNTVELNNLRVFPNPANTELFVQSSTEIPLSISITEPGGKKVSSITPTQNISILNVSALSVGLYILEIEMPCGTKESVRVLKR